MKLFRRKRVIVDKSFQGAMLLRIVMYWCVSLIAFAQLVFLWKIISGQMGETGDYFRLDHLWEENRAFFLTSLTLLPIFLLDTALMSNRFAGPFYRIRSSIRALAAGQSIQPLKLREKDYWREVAQDVNELHQYIEHLKAQLAAAKNHSQESDSEKSGFELIVA